MFIELLCGLNSGEYHKGDIVDLPEAQARELIRVNAAKETESRKATPPRKKAEQLHPYKAPVGKAPQKTAAPLEPPKQAKKGRKKKES